MTLIICPLSMYPARAHFHALPCSSAPLLLPLKGKPNAPEETRLLYHPRVAFWPTVSQELRVQPDEVQSYFDWFARVPGLKVRNGF